MIMVGWAGCGLGGRRGWGSDARMRTRGRVPCAPNLTATCGRGRLLDHQGGTVADTYNGYCVKCKEKRDFDGEVNVSDSGRRMAKGICPVCGTKMNRILGKA
jgi:hypothetical protein